MKKHTIRLHPLGKELLANDQTPLIDVLYGFGIEFPSGGKRTFGKYKVRLLNGEIKTMSTSGNQTNSILIHFLYCRRFLLAIFRSVQMNFQPMK